MQIKEISFDEFDSFAKNHPLSNYHQTSEYALLMANQGYDYDYIGYLDNDNVIVAAALILYKKIGLIYRYGYSPKGFLIDYFNQELLKQFTKDLKSYYQEKGFAFIKINPEIAIGEISTNPYQVKYNQNVMIRNTLKKNGYLKLKDNLYFESMIPRFNGIVHLPSFNYEKLSKNTKNKIVQANRKGLVFEKVGREYIDEFYKFIKLKKKRDLNFYKDYYNIFDKNNFVDLFLIGIDYEQYLLRTKEAYEKELERNNIFNELLHHSASEKRINEKMNSDRTLLKYKTDIVEATNGLSENKKVYIAGAMTIKFNNRVYIVMSGYDKKYKHFNPNYFLHYSILNYYKDKFTYVDLNGLTGDFSKENPYYGLNKFKMGFNPKIYEFIGEYDLVINERAYIKLVNLGILSKEFNKNDIK